MLLARLVAAYSPMECRGFPGGAAARDAMESWREISGLALLRLAYGRLKATIATNSAINPDSQRTQRMPRGDTIRQLDQRVACIARTDRSMHHRRCTVRSALSP